MSKKQYYDIEPILRTGAQYLIIIGQRANGKSYACKRYALEQAWNNPETSKFALLRRKKEGIKHREMTQYFSDMSECIKEISGGEADCIVEYQKVFFFAKRDPEGKEAPQKIREAGYVFALSAEEDYKSSIYMDIHSIIYEEFITKQYYLRQEPTLLMSFVSTILRSREGKVFLIGNTISRVCPYVTDWGLHNLLRQKQGTIELYHAMDPELLDDEGEPIVTDIAVEFCSDTAARSSMFIGRASKSIIKGVWDTELKPGLRFPPHEYQQIHEMVIQVMNFKFYCRLLSRQNTMVWYVEPKTSEIQKGTRVISDRFNESRLWSKGFYPLNDKEAYAFNLLKQGKICFSDSLTGTDFEQCLKHLTL